MWKEQSTRTLMQSTASTFAWMNKIKLKSKLNQAKSFPGQDLKPVLPAKIKHEYVSPCNILERPIFGGCSDTPISEVCAATI